MDDAFSLLRRATGLLPRDARIAIGATVEDVHDHERRQDWAFVLDLLLEFGDEHPLSGEFWSLLAAAARLLMLDGTARWCDWRAGEARDGVIHARLDLLRTGDGGRRTAFSAQGQLRPLWNIAAAGSKVATDESLRGEALRDRYGPGGEPELRVARLWAEDAARPAPGESATVRLAPLNPGRWRHLAPGDVITMHEGTPAVGTATIIQVAPPVEIPARPGDPED
ncbi:hypothetical protein [Streptomyces sp. bgisy032]|uniref:hypothetical protein n=1 Tax=Streptomyces sp. bgisy032 TaxID=3413773 RepID=UPI003D744A22